MIGCQFLPIDGGSGPGTYIEKAAVFVTFSHFDPSLIFTVRAVAYLRFFYPYRYLL
jgi:hypothetical protein